MVRQGAVRLGFQLLEQLVFVFWSHTPGTTRGTADTAQGAEVMLDQIQLHRLKMNLELSRDLSARSARQDSLDDSFPQIQTVSPTPDSAVHALIMQNALVPAPAALPAHFRLRRGVGLLGPRELLAAIQAL